MRETLSSAGTILSFAMIGVGGVLVIGLGLASILQNRFLYRSGNFGQNRDPKRNKAGYRLPSDRSIPYEAVSIISEDGILLRGWLMFQLQRQSVPTVIFFQGSGGNIGQRMGTFELLYKELGVNVLAVSYRGYGESEGAASEVGLQRDIQAIMKFALEEAGVDPEKVILHGRSLGGAAAIYGAWSSQVYESMQVKGLIVENTFTSVPDLVGDLYPQIALFRNAVLRNYWPSLSRIASITCPILFISGEADELIPPAHMHRLYCGASSASKRVFVSPT